MIRTDFKPGTDTSVLSVKDCSAPLTIRKAEVSPYLQDSRSRSAMISETMKPTIFPYLSPGNSSGTVAELQ